MLSEGHTGWLLAGKKLHLKRELLLHYFKKPNNKDLDRRPCATFEDLFLIKNNTNQDITILQGHLHSLKDKRILSVEGYKGIDTLELPQGDSLKRV